MTPPYAGTFTYYMKALKNGLMYDKRSFSVIINPKVISVASFDFDPTYESTTTLFPNK